MQGKAGAHGGSPGKLITSSGLPLQELVPVGEEDLFHRKTWEMVYCPRGNFHRKPLL